METVFLVGDGYKAMICTSQLLMAWYLNTMYASNTVYEPVSTKICMMGAVDEKKIIKYYFGIN